MTIDSKTHRELIEAAEYYGICKPWLKELKETTDTKNLIRMFIKGADFCLNNHYPTAEYIEEHFEDEAASEGIYVRGRFLGKDASHIVAMGTAEGAAEYTGFAVGRIYVTDEASIIIEAEGNSFLIVDALEHAYVFVRANDDAKVVVNKYGAASTIATEPTDRAVVKVIDKQKSNY